MAIAESERRPRESAIFLVETQMAWSTLREVKREALRLRAQRRIG